MPTYFQLRSFLGNAAGGPVTVNARCQSAHWRRFAGRADMRVVPGLPRRIANPQGSSASDCGHRHPVHHAILSESQATPPACPLLLWEPEETLQVREMVVKAMCGIGRLYQRILPNCRLRHHRADISRHSPRRRSCGSALSAKMAKTAAHTRRSWPRAMKQPCQPYGEAHRACAVWTVRGEAVRGAAYGVLPAVRLTISNISFRLRLRR
jgi:hypothetical protein